MEPKRPTLEEELKELYARVPAPPGGLSEGRRRILAEAARGKIRVLPPKGRRAVLLGRIRAARVFRPLAISAAVLLVLMLAGGGVVVAAGDSLPGDALYPVKLAVEDVCLALTGDPVAQAVQNLSFVTERVEEMKGLADRGESIPNDLVVRMAEQVDRIVVEAAAASPEKATGLLEQLQQRMCVQQQVLGEIQIAGSAGDQEAVNLALQITERARQAADLAEGDPGRLQVEYMNQVEADQPSTGEPQPDNGHQFQSEEINGQPAEPAGGDNSDSEEGTTGSDCGPVESELEPSDVAPPRSSIWGNRGARPVQTTESESSVERGSSRGLNR